MNNGTMHGLTPEQAATRNAFGQGPSPKRETVEYNGHQLDIVQPTLEEHDEIYRRATSTDVEVDESGGKAKPKVSVRVDQTKLRVLSIIKLTCFHGTEQRVFTEVDYAHIAKSYRGSGYDQLGRVARELLDAKGEDPAKKSEPTPTKPSSTSSP